ncbi:MAG: electron transport complex subunit RsxG [Thiotrichaceae bacterium]
MNKELFKNILKPTLMLGAFAFAGVLLLSIVNQQTLQRIVDNERAAMMKLLMEVIDIDSHDNDLVNDSIELAAEGFQSSKPVTVYRARKQGQPSAAIFVTNTLKGYKGSIKIIIGVRMDNTLSGVRVVQHNETPGLGDKMETRKSSWILAFDNTSLQRPELSKWGVKKDNGYFDQFTGATITPRAIVRAVRDVLLWTNKKDNLASVFTQQK